MADKKISQLSNIAPAAGTDELPINRAGTSGKLTITEITAIEKAERVAADGALPSLTTTNKSNLVAAINEVNSSIAGKMPLSYLDIDPLLAANSDTKVASQKAVKAYITSVLPTDATETIKGIAEIATQAETNTGTDDTRFITPLKLKTNIATYGYLTGTLTGNTLPIYNSTISTLVDSVIKQSSSGNRILVNGVTDDTATAFQVSGSIRQTSVTSKIAAFDATGKLVDGGSGNAGYISKFSGSGTFLGNSLIRDDATSVGINVAPSTSGQLYVRSTSLFSAIRGVNSFVSFASDTSYGIAASAIGANPAGNIGLLASANTSPTSNIAGQFIASGTGSYAIQLQDGSQGIGKFLKDVTGSGHAQWSNITTADIQGISGAANKLAFYSGSNLLTYNNNVSIDATYPSITLTAAAGDYGIMTGYGFEARNINGAYSVLSTASNTEYSYIGFNRRRGNNTTELPPQSGDLLGQILFNGNDAGVLIEALATETQSVNSGSKLRFRTVRTGYTLADTKERLSIEGDGKVRINENYSLPDVDGAANDVMKTNGAGVASWGKVTSASTTGATNTTGITVSTGPTSNATFYISNGLITNIGYASW